MRTISGALLIDGGDLFADGLTVTHATAGGRGGAFAVRGSSHVELRELVAEGCSALVGGTVAVETGDLQLHGAVIVKSIATSHGGAVDVLRGTATLSAVKVTGSSAPLGGAVAVEASSVLLTEVQIDGTSAGSGGAIYQVPA